MLPQRGEPALSSSRFPFQKRVSQTRKASVLESGSRWKAKRRQRRPALLLSGGLTPRPATRGPKSTLEAVNRANKDFEARHACRPSQRRELRVQLRGHPNADLGIIAHALSVDPSGRSSSFPGSPSFSSHNPSSPMHPTFVLTQIRSSHRPRVGCSKEFATRRPPWICCAEIRASTKGARNCEVLESVVRLRT